MSVLGLSGSVWGRQPKIIKNRTKNGVPHRPPEAKNGVPHRLRGPQMRSSVLRPCWGPPGGRLGGVLARLGCVLARLGGVLGASWRVLARLGCVLARLGGVLGASWGRLGRLLARLGRILARLGRILLPIPS